MDILNFKSIRYFIGFFVIALLIGSLIFNYTIVLKIIDTDKAKTALYNEKYGVDQLNQTDSTQPVKYPAQQYLSETETPEYKAIGLIRNLHASADFLLTGGKVEKYTLENEDGWNELLKADIMQASNYDKIIENFAVEPDIVLDMNNIKALLSIASEKRDRNALKYLHRILHDLDFFAYPPNGQLSTDFWGATHTAPSELSKMLKEIEAYISTNTNKD